ncbi:transposase [Gluconobacter thailandicus NBRC 3257]|uniref:Transposase n=1 Tax=Gluconobacter thailandicus NBRC 3257 TaxID=1381097 RepID=A0ABQ0IZC7_GLUTH|nr:transposase [Gluconobacter thailandicus]GAC89146.1 transposase [Gluconobacter thailandicus NBRC 3255]GAD27561.1 transposase [Gluconobacter thailandicus NBRC 3257]GBR60196.1 transposase [Gluconobacter thailandicus F149-1 = NBRC 100600]
MDDLTFVVRHFLLHLNRDSVWRILKGAGLNRLSLTPKAGPVRGKGTFRDYDPGYVHVDVKHLPKLQTADGERRKRYLYVAIDRCSRSVHLSIHDAENAVDFLKAVKAAFPFRITHILTDRGSCFTADAFEKACCDMTIDRRRTKAYSSQTNGMVERFNGRVATEALQVCVASHEDLEILLKGFCFAYNHRKQRALAGLFPVEHIASWLKKHPGSRNADHVKPFRHDFMKQVDQILKYAKDVSQPDTEQVRQGRLRSLNLGREDGFLAHIHIEEQLLARQQHGDAIQTSQCALRQTQPFQQGEGSKNRWLMRLARNFRVVAC